MTRTAQASSKLDADRFRNVHRLMTGGSTDGERSAARARAEVLAAKAGMSLKGILSNFDAVHYASPDDLFDEFNAWMDAHQPGWRTATMVGPIFIAENGEGPGVRLRKNVGWRDGGKRPDELDATTDD